MTPDSILMSVRPQYAEKILRGEKTVELRRVRPRVSRGDVIVMYVTSPKSEVRALLEVEEVLEAHPAALWSAVGSTAGVSIGEYEEYFQGSGTGVGISLRVVEHLKEPVTLDELRAMSPGFRPPQSYRYIAGLTCRMQSLFTSLWKKSRTRAPAAS